MKLLLDTHVFLWWRSDARELGDQARRAILDADNEVYVSAVVGWEIVIKRALGKLEFEGRVEAAVTEEGFLPLPVLMTHVDDLAVLPEHHRDPFDRLLIVQALAAGLVIVTADPLIRQYEGLGLLEGGRRRRAAPRR